MAGWDIVYFILGVLILVGAYYLLHRSEKNTKNKCKKDAYDLLESKNPDPKKIKQTLTFLRLYGGRFRKDHEFGQLQMELSQMLDEIEPSKSKENLKR
jgi:hypothetical protein